MPASSRPGTTKGPSVTYLTEGRLVACGLVAATQMSWGSVVPALPHYTAAFGMGALGLGAIIAAFGAGRLIVNIPAGIVSRYLPAGPFLVVTVVAVLVCTVVTGLLTAFIPVLILRFIAGIFAGAAITVGQALVVGSAPSSTRGRASSVLQAFQLAGAAAGPALGGGAMSLFGIFPAFLAAASGCFVFLVWAGVRWRAVHVGTVASPVGRDSRSSSTVRAPRRRRVRVGVVFALAAMNGVGFVIFAVRFGGQQSLIPLLSVRLADVEPWQLGLGLGSITVVSLALLPLVGAVSDRWDRRWIIAPSLGLSAAATPLFLLVDDPLTFLAVMLAVGVLGSLAGGLPLASLADAVEPHRFGVTTGIYRTFGDLGTIVGPIGLTAVYAQFGADVALLALAGLTLVGAALACIRLPPSRTDLSAVDALHQGDLVGAVVPGADLERSTVAK